MELFNLLSSEKDIFLIDDVEDKKTKALIGDVNSDLFAILGKYEELNSFFESQLEGEYHKKLVMAKSLKKNYNGWATINNACLALEKEEKSQIEKFNSFRNKLVSNLNVLLKDSLKLPVVSACDVVNDEYIFVRKGHNMIILGQNNTIILEKMISDLENLFVLEGNYASVEEKELIANYNSVDKNVESCREKIGELFANKPSKAEKIETIVSSMDKVARDLVLFVTYKEEMKNVGCLSKEVDLYEKELVKKYIPMKKQLRKVLKVDLIDVCDIIVDESEIAEEDSDFDLED